MLRSGDAQILALILAGEARTAGLADALDVPARSMYRTLARLQKEGLVKQVRKRWLLTGAGERAALSPVVPEPTAAIALLGKLPAEHRAVLRLIEDAVVARRALHDVYPREWPGFLLLGPTGTGKGLVMDLAAHRFDLEPQEAVRVLMPRSRRPGVWSVGGCRPEAGS